MGNFKIGKTLLIAVSFLCGVLTCTSASAQTPSQQGYNTIPSVMTVCPLGYTFNPNDISPRQEPCSDGHGNYRFGTPILDWIYLSWISDLQAKLGTAQDLSNSLQIKLEVQAKQLDGQSKLLNAEAYEIADLEKRLSILKRHQ